MQRGTGKPEYRHRDAKAAYKQRIDNHVSNLDHISIWNNNSSLTSRRSSPGLSINPAPDAQPADLICIVHSRKSAVPDGVPGKVLRDCAAEIIEVFKNYLNLYLLQSTVHPLHLPEALIPVNVKFLEKLVLK